MQRRFVHFLLCANLFAIPICGATIAQCTPTFSACAIPENIFLQLPFGAFAGDVILVEPDMVTVSDVFRIFNNLLNTGKGTGLGNMAFLYSVDDDALPNPSTYSANAVTIPEDPSGFTHYVGNGTDYLLNAPEPSTLSLCAFGIAIAVLTRRRWTSWSLGSQRARSIAALAILCCSPAFTQVTIDLVDGQVPVSAKLDLPIGMGPAQTAPELSATTAGLSFYTANYTALADASLPFNIVGTDPSLGANTTTIPTILVPLRFVFPNPGNPTLDGANVIPATQNSPIFLAANYNAGSTNLGTTQYGDALQRAQFWNLPGFSPDYHVLLGTPSIAPTVTITVLANAGNAYLLSSGGFLGVVDTTFYNQTLAALLPSYSANQLPIFVTDNVFLGTGGVIQNCCVLGFHNSQGLSHEVAEWLNDPFVGAFALGFLNLVPPAVLPGQGGSCIVNFETGDPLESPPATFTKTTNSTVYQLQDAVTLPWYLHTTPSFSVNGWYTFHNTTAVIPLVVNSPASIAGSYTNTAKLSFAPINTAVTGDVAYLGAVALLARSARAARPTPYLADPDGKIALIDRGACAVSLKIDAAAKAGAIGALIGLVAPGDAVSFVSGGGSVFVPSLVVTQSTSNAIKSALALSTVNATLSLLNEILPSFSALCGPG